jgi:hypothetical protein
LLAIGLYGCAGVFGDIYYHEPSLSDDGGWGWPVPIVRPGSPFLFVKRQYTRQESWRTHGGNIGFRETVRRTKVSRLDVVTCNRIESTTFSGDAKVEAWGTDPREIWIRTNEDPSVLRSLGGEKLKAPPLASPEGDILEPGGMRMAQDSVRIWDPAHRTVDQVAFPLPPATNRSVPQRAGGRFVLDLQQLGTARQTRASFTNLLGSRGETLQTAAPILVESDSLAETRLLEDGHRLALQAHIGESGVISTFSLPDGALLSRFEVAAWHDVDPLWSPSGGVLAFVPDDDPQPFVACGHTLRVVDVTGTLLRERTFDACVRSAAWTKDEARLLVASNRDPRWWSLDLRSGNAVAIPGAVNASTPRAVEIGETIFYVTGAEHLRYLMAVSLTSGRTWQVTQPLGEIGLLVADDVARKLYVGTDREFMSVYDLRSHKLSLCSY